MNSHGKRQDNSRLAILGGDPIRRRTWPKWPRFNSNTKKLINDVFNSGRWTISSQYTGKKPYERQFSEAFTRYYDIPFCVLTTSGSTALAIALESLNVGRGQEVLVPGIAWVACAAAVVSVGGIPIPVDIDPDSLCMSPDAALNSITGKTGAILLVHQNCSLANVEAFLAISKQRGIPILEDCAAAHGASVNDKHVGGFGKVAAFSFQQNKLLTCGEGGSVITSDIDTYNRLQQLRANGRQYIDSPQKGQMEIEAVGSVMGNNYVLSEFHAAILLDRLQYLDEESEIRDSNVKYLNSMLCEIGGITPLCSGNKQGRLAYHKYTVRLSLDAFDNNDAQTLSEAISAELCFSGIGTLDEPLNRNRLFNPYSSPRFPLTEDSEYDPKRFSLPIATKAVQECLYIRHWAFLGSKRDMEDIANAFGKVKKWADQLHNIRASKYPDRG